jgi:hypothetical protein
MITRPAPDGIDTQDWHDRNGLGAVLPEQHRTGEPAWATDLRPCPGSCAARLELLSIAEALRTELAAAVAEAHLLRGSSRRTG